MIFLKKNIFLQIYLDEIINYFVEHDSFKEVVKWFNFDCCRGNNTDVVRVNPRINSDNISIIPSTAIKIEPFNNFFETVMFYKIIDDFIKVNL